VVFPARFLWHTSLQYLFILMSCFSTLRLLICLFLFYESSSLGHLLLLTLIFVFIMVDCTCSFPFRGLAAFLSSCLLFVVLVFLSTASLLIFFIRYELSLFPISLIILFHGYQPEKVKAFVYILLYTVICSAPFLYFVLSLQSSLSTGLCSLCPSASFLVCLSFIVKTPLYTLHSWLPKAHVEASLFGSMLLAGVILKLGRYGVLLLSPSLVYHSYIYVYLTLSGGVICSVLCCRS